MDSPRRPTTSKTGRVYLVGAGPGGPDLLTLRAARLLGQADVVVYDRLVDPAILELTHPEAERIFAGKMRAHHTVPQPDINALLVERARRGLMVVRLKGGDPFIFGRGGEELEALVAAAIPFEIVPGVTAATGCAAFAGIPLTHRDHAQTLIFVTGHGKEGEADLNWSGLAQPRQTIVVYMGHAGLDRLCRKLVEHGLPANLPAAMVENGTLPHQRVVLGTLADLADRVRRAAVTGPALVVIGAVVALHARFAWYAAESEPLVVEMPVQ